MASSLMFLSELLSDLIIALSAILGLELLRARIIAASLMFVGGKLLRDLIKACLLMSNLSTDLSALNKASPAMFSPLLLKALKRAASFGVVAAP